MFSLNIFCDKIFADRIGASIPAADIPYVETSDEEALPKKPVVSVRIVTYNHEKFIRECIDSVLSQKTDFDFEIVIGEDCSQDKTREICFEYQKKHPDKIRVIWWHENVSKLGGNGRRTIAHCRGEYVAFLEGDDYWTDPLKLQKQVDLIRATSSIGCVANYATLYLSGQLKESKYKSNGFVTHHDLAKFYPHTATYVMRRDFLENRERLYPKIHVWYDVVLMHCLVETGQVAHLQDVVSVYRLTGNGIATSLSGQEKQILAIKQYLDLYLHGPKSCHRRFGSQVMTYIAYFFNHTTSGWSKEFTNKYAGDFKHAFWTIYRRQPFDLRTIRALMRYLRFRVGMTK